MAAICSGVRVMAPMPPLLLAIALVICEAVLVRFDDVANAPWQPLQFAV